MDKYKFEFDSSKRSAKRTDQFIIAFESAGEDISQKGHLDPSTILKRYLQAFSEAFNSPLVILLKVAEDKVEVTDIFSESDDVGIKEKDQLSREGFIKSILEKREDGIWASQTERAFDEKDPLYKKGIRSCCAIRYQYKRETRLLLLCNWPVYDDIGDAIESSEIKLAKIAMELLVSVADVEFFIERVKAETELSKNNENCKNAVDKARDDGSRTELYDACERYIKFCKDHPSEKVPDDVMADYLDTMISRFILPAKEPIGISREDIENRLLDLKETEMLTTLSLSKAWAIIAANSDSEKKEKWLVKAENLFEEVKFPSQDEIKREELWNNLQILYFQTQCTLVYARCEEIRKSAKVDSKKIDEIHDKIQTKASEIRKLLWQLLSLISKNNEDNLMDNLRKNLLLKESENSPQEGINIETLWLKTWFCAHLLEEKVLARLINDSSLAPLSRLSFCYHLSIFVSHILHRVRTSQTKSPVTFLHGTERAVQSFIYLISQYAHSCCEVPRSIRICDFLRRLWEMRRIGGHNTHFL